MSILIDINRFEERIQTADSIEGLRRLVRTISKVKMPDKLVYNLRVDLAERAKELTK